MTFAGRWFTTYGHMLLTQDGDRVRGTYGHEGTENTIEGTATADTLAFRYVEAHEKGTGWFKLHRHGSFAGEYLAEVNTWPRPWQGWRNWDGLWDTHLGRLRLVQDDAGAVFGFFEYDDAMRLQGRPDGARLAFTLNTATSAGSGTLELDVTGTAINGTWKPDGQEVREFGGRRALARPGLSWLVVLEAYWQHSLDENEFAFGRMLDALFARVARVRVRHRFFHDEASLLHWCRQLWFLPDAAVLVVAGHGGPTGISVNGRIVPLGHIIRGLKLADTLQLLHFSACMVGQDSEKALAATPFPVSGYTTTVDWSQSALTEFVYLDMILAKGLTPAAAAGQLVSLVRFAGDEEIVSSPYRPAGFCFFPAHAP